MSRSKQKKRALVLGASGHLGRAFVGALEAGGYRVTAVLRRKRLPFLEGTNVRILRADLDEPEHQSDARREHWLFREAARHDLVVDAAAPYPVSLIDAGHAVDRAHRRMHLVVRAVMSCDRPLIYISSVSTLVRKRSPADELFSRARRRSHPYFAAKKAMESIVVSACERGLKAVIVNPTACFGPWDDKSPNRSFVRAFARGAVPLVAKDPINVVDVRDVAWVGLAALEQGWFGEPLLCSGHDTSVDELARLFAHLTSARAPLSWPLAGTTSVLSAVVFGVEQVCAALRVEVPPAALASMLLLDIGHTGKSPVMRALGIRPLPLRKTVMDSVVSDRERRRLSDALDDPSDHFAEKVSVSRRR